MLSWEASSKVYLSPACDSLLSSPLGFFSSHFTSVLIYLSLSVFQDVILSQPVISPPGRLTWGAGLQKKKFLKGGRWWGTEFTWPKAFVRILPVWNESSSSHCNCSLIKIQIAVPLLFTLMIIQLIVVFPSTENWMKKEICILTEHAARENNKWKSKAQLPDECMQKNRFAWEFTLSITTGSLPLMAFFWWKWYKHLIFLRRKCVMFKNAQNCLPSQSAWVGRPGRTKLWMRECHKQHSLRAAQFMWWIPEKEIIMQIRIIYLHSPATFGVKAEPLVCTNSLAQLMLSFPVTTDRACACRTASPWKWKDIIQAWITRIRAGSVLKSSSAQSQCAWLLLVTATAAVAVLWVGLEAQLPAVSRVDVLEMYRANPWQSDSSLVSAWFFKRKAE